VDARPELDLNEEYELPGMKCANWILAILFLVGAIVLSGVGRIGPSGDLVREGMPEIPDSLSEEVSYYSVSRSAELMAWHPLKREILVLPEHSRLFRLRQDVP